MLRKNYLAVLVLLGLCAGTSSFAYDREDFEDERRDRRRNSRNCVIRNNKIVLKLRGEIFRGRNTLFLKKMIHRNCSLNRPLHDLHLRGVKLVAKSRGGMGYSRLRVGPNFSSRHRVGGFSRDFYSNYNYDRVFIRNPSRFGDSHGPWQIKLRGMIKVRKLVLFVDDLHDDWD